MQRLQVQAAKTVGFWAWELERLPSYWRHAFSFFDEIWASTRFAENAFRGEHLRPVRLMPMAVVAPAVEREISRRELKLPKDATVFLFVFDFRSFATRKNPEAVVEAFLRAFPSGDESVFLVIKSMGAEENCSQLEFLTSLCTDPRISLRDIRLDRDELLGLIKASDAFVSLHRSEGFGRGPAEAMLLGRPTILTDYSGTKDFTSEDTAFLVDYQLVRVQPGEYIGVDGQNWADANVETAARHMRSIYENPMKARRVGALGKQQVTRLLSPSVIGPKLHGALTRLVSDERAQSPQARKRSRVAGKTQEPLRMRHVSTRRPTGRGAQTESGIA
jgi:glycosyltransferase involved in cell wall biosynthesis